jgi:putative membrane protein
MIAELTTAIALLAHIEGHHDGGWWWLMAIGMIVFWGAVIWLVVWLARGGLSALSARGREPGALEILDRRLAEGSIEVEEYEQRRAALSRLSGDS